MGEATFDLLACSQAQLDDGVEHDVLLVLLVNIGEQVVRHADLVGVQTGGFVERRHGVQQILRHLGILGRCLLAGSGQHCFVVDQFLDSHKTSFASTPAQTCAHAFPHARSHAPADVLLYNRFRYSIVYAATHRGRFNLHGENESEAAQQANSRCQPANGWAAAC